MKFLMKSEKKQMWSLGCKNALLWEQKHMLSKVAMKRKLNQTKSNYKINQEKEQLNNKIAV